MDRPSIVDKIIEPKTLQYGPHGVRESNLWPEIAQFIFQFPHLEILLGLLNNFSLVQLIDLQNVFFRQVFETLATQKQNLEGKKYIH